MKSKLSVLFAFILILPLILLNREYLSLARSRDQVLGEVVQSGVIREDIDEASGLGQIQADDASRGFVAINPQQIDQFPVYGPATLLQEEVDESIIDLLPAYANITDNLENSPMVSWFDIIDFLSSKIVKARPSVPKSIMSTS